MFPYVRVKIGQKRNFQPLLPLMRSRAFGRRMAYWHARIMRMTGKSHTYTRVYRMPYLRCRTARARAYMREWERKHKGMHPTVRPSAFVGVYINHHVIS